MVPGIQGPFLVGQAVDLSNSRTGSGAGQAEGKVEAGFAFYNTLGALTKGTLVYPTSYHALGRVVAKADGDASAKFPVYVIAEDTADATLGMMVERGVLQVASFDTSGSTVGNPVYASGTAGAVTLTNSGGLPIVGRVAYPLSASGGSGYVAFDIPGEKANAGSGGVFYAADGTAAAPSVTYATDPDTGFYHVAANTEGLAFGGVAGLAFSNSAGSAAVSAASNTAGQDVFILATKGGTVTSAATVGGALTVGAGAGGASAVAFAGGAGGARSDVAGNGGANTGGASGQSGGAGGAYVDAGGTGGATNSTNGAHAGGVGGAMTSRGGTGGANTGAGDAGAGGAALYTGGLGGNSAAGNGGAGGDVTVRGGSAGTGGNAAGGNVDLIPGAKTGTGLAGEVRVNSSTAGFLPVSTFWDPSDVDRPFFVASRAYRVKAATARVEVAGTDGGAVTAVIKKAASATAITAGTALHSGSIDLKGAAATNQVLALSATAADLEIAAGTCIGIDYTGTLTSAVGCVTITLAPV